MPTYEYQCTACSHRFEQFQSIKADPLKNCPQCRKDALARLIGPGAALIFKGSGFYLTDYRSDNYRKAAKAEKESSGGAKSDGGSKGDTTPAKSDAAPAPAKPASDS